MSSALVFRSIAGSNLPASQKKSALRSMYERVTGNTSMMSKAKATAIATGHTIRQGGESIVVGGLLGAAHCELKTGLDVSVPVGSKTLNVPIDAVAAVTLMVAGVALATDEVAVDLRNAGSSAASVFAFRKTYDVMAERKKAAGGLPGGKFAGDSVGFGVENDRILQAVRGL